VSVAERVLLVGKRAAALKRLQAALREIGIEADLTQDTAAAERDQSITSWGGRRVRRDAAAEVLTKAVAISGG
jgi:hypothetical protein